MHLKIKSKIVFGSSLVLVLVVILSLISFRSFDSFVEDANWVKHTQQVIANASIIEKLIVDLETGQRGFLITGKKEFLEPYETGNRELLNLLDETKLLILDNPIQIEKLNKIKQTIKLWHEKVGAPEILAHREVNNRAATVTDVVSLIKEGTGKRVMDKIRLQLREFKQVEFELMSVRERESERGILFSKYVIIFGTLILLISSLVWSYWLADSISKPLNILKIASDDIKEGIYPEKIHIDSNDEIADLGNAFENMAHNLKSNHEKLLSYQKNLEDLVEERTQELKNSQKQLLHSEKLSALGKITSSISHEFNNPLQGLRNVIDILSSSAPSEKEEKLAELAKKECDRLAKMIVNLRGFSKPSSGKISSVDINQCMEEVLSLQNESLRIRGIQVNQQFSDQIPKVKGVQDQIKQVIINIIQNAADSISGKGRITLTTEKRNSHIVLKIQDTGSGISEDDKKHLFEPFFTTKETEKGSGLGLSISYGIIQKHGGKIEVESELGKGSTFSVNLPITG